MTDAQPTIDGKPLTGEDKPRPEGIELDTNGDPIRQGSLMNERQSYERVIEGLKIASDAAMHLTKLEGRNGHQWRHIAGNLDQVRRICVQHAGLGLTLKERQTEEVRGDPMGYKLSRDRFREGLIQAAGGMRQLATCHRGDFWWSKCATELEKLEYSIRNPKRQRLLGANGSPLILPPGFVRH
jgi:hypothetical protein